MKVFGETRKWYTPALVQAAMKQHGIHKKLIMTYMYSFFNISLNSMASLLYFFDSRHSLNCIGHTSYTALLRKVSSGSNGKIREFEGPLPNQHPWMLHLKMADGFVVQINHLQIKLLDYQRTKRSIYWALILPYLMIHHLSLLVTCIYNHKLIKCDGKSYNFDLFTSS